MSERRDEESGDESDDEPAYKRARPGFSDHASEPPPDMQLEAMLAAHNKGAAGFGGMGGDKGKGKGKPVGFHGPAGLAGMPDLPNEPRVETTRMDFSKLTREMPHVTVEVQKDLVGPLMTPEHRQFLAEETGARIEWNPDHRQVLLSGSAEQTKRAQRLLARVIMHCRWGANVEKVRRLLRPRKVESVLCRLSPMNTLRPGQKTLSPSAPALTIGKDKQNDVTIGDPQISRQHCVLEFDDERGAVYVLDCSTNGTFLNGIRLPSKSVGKVLLSHGDELLFKDPASGEQEFGYIVNLKELAVKAEVKLEAPRRMLTAEEQSSIGRHFV